MNRDTHPKKPRTRLVVVFAIGLALLGLLAAGSLRGGGGSEPGAASAAPAPVAVSVRAVEAVRGNVNAWVFAEGTARSARRAYLAFEVAGKVDWIADGPGGEPLRAGDAVTAGQTLAKLDARRVQVAARTAEAAVREAQTQATAAAAEVEQARADLSLRTLNLNKVTRLAQAGGAPPQELEEAQANAASAEAKLAGARSRVASAAASLETARARLDEQAVDAEQIALTSPIDGVVAYLNTEVGFYFQPSSIRTDDETNALLTVPIVVIDPTRFEVTVDVPAFQRLSLKPGQPARIVTGPGSTEEMVRGDGESADRGLGALPEGTVRGFVSTVNPAVSPGSRSVQVRIRTHESEGASDGLSPLQDGQHVTTWVQTDTREDVVVVPLSTLLHRDNRPYALVVNPTTQTAELRELRLGLQGFDTQEVISGVEPGERLVTDGRYQLSDGTPVRVIAERETTGE